jgi:formate dehydrogenase major subunit
VPGLGTSFGRGGATTALQDLQNSDAILIIGSSMAENHPVGFKWVVEARERGATIIHVDPRFTRTSAMADMWVPLRAGTDAAFLGAMVNYVLANRLEFRDYVVAYTNASTIIDDRFVGPEDLDGLFSGWDAEAGRYTTDSWAYARDEARDPTLLHPRSVFQIIGRHFARYTPAMVAEVCGVPADSFVRICEAFCRASGPERTAAICYAVGLTQHSAGVQVVRTAAILQLLLGNIGRPGGGILALRGHASIQGSTDIPTLYDLLPGYLPMPTFDEADSTLAAYVGSHRSQDGWWANFDKYAVSLLKAWYGELATAENDFGFGWLPRTSGDHSHFGYWLDMADGTPRSDLDVLPGPSRDDQRGENRDLTPDRRANRLEGLFVMGQNPAVGAPNARLERRALANLQWLVVRDMVETETATFWQDSPEVQRGELRTEGIRTEVFFFPAAAHAEKSGCFTNTQRLLQWHQTAIDPPGDARSEAWFIYHLGRRLKARASGDLRRRNRGLNALTWNYPTSGPRGEPEIEQVLQEINGRWTRDGSQVKSFSDLAADGKTACGCWIYSGVYPAADRNRAAERHASGPYGHGWGFAWPADRRILYNRASARPDGTPWSERKKLVWWDAERRAWTGLDTPDFTENKAPDYVPPPGADGDAAVRGDAPFIMHSDGLGWIWVPVGLRDGPLPVHYEPLESPVPNRLYRQQVNPVADRKERPDNKYARSPGDPRYPHVLTTYRLTEHHTAGGMSRTLSHLAELQPELFCEISPVLAAEINIENGAWVRISTPRGAIEARALVTPRLQPLTIHGLVVHQVGLPYHFGGRGLIRGDVVNDLVAISEEPNVRIMEAKGLLCKVTARDQ